jgi:plasmid stability protein
VIVMAAVSIRDLDDRVKDRLRVRAAENGRSMEAEIRAILSDAVGESQQTLGLGQALMARFAAAGGVDVELPIRGEQPRAATMSR